MSGLKDESGEERPMTISFVTYTSIGCLRVLMTNNMRPDSTGCASSSISGFFITTVLACFDFNVAPHEAQRSAEAGFFLPQFGHKIGSSGPLCTERAFP